MRYNRHRRRRVPPRSRLEFFRSHPAAHTWAVPDTPKNEAVHAADHPHMPRPNSLNGKDIVIIGSGIGALTTAYELLSRNDAVNVTILEARDHYGGRCLTLRTGDTLLEDKTSDLYNNNGTGGVTTQVVRFNQPLGDKKPYLNAGPGRIPSSHKHLLGYLHRFGVELEVYIMTSDSNMTQLAEGPFGDDAVVNRRLDHNTRGWIAEMVYKNARSLLEANISTSCKDRRGRKHRDISALVQRLESLMVTFGDLDESGNYNVGTPAIGTDEAVNVSDRAGFKQLPDVRPGEISEAIQLETLLESEFWMKTSVYQPVDFLWQPSMFHPVGGMDHVAHAFQEQVATLGGVLHLNRPVTKVEYKNGRFAITADGPEEIFMADYCISNVPIPFLEHILSDELQGLTNQRNSFDLDFKEGLHAVYATQKNEDPLSRFLAHTTKVGWQADRSLWQGAEVDSDSKVPDSQVGVVPVYGGISWTDHPITQIWYPSTSYQDKRGVLTGCYNFEEDALEYGEMTIADRLKDAKEGAAGFGEDFAEGLENGVAIAWQNQAYIKGGWAQWFNVGQQAGNGESESAKHFNAIVQGTGVNGSNPCFFVVGDQASSLPGWQEGAIFSALNAIGRIARPDLPVPYVKTLPDPRLMVQGL